MIQDNKLVAVIYALIGFSCFSITDASYKWLASEAPVYTNIFIVSLGAVFPVFFYGLFSGKRLSFWYNPKRNIHILRGLMVGIHIPILVLVFSKLPLTQAYTVFFTTPFFVAIFAWLFLKEKLNFKVFATITIGFLGVYIAYRPEISDFENPWLICAFAGAAIGAINNILARYIGQGKDNAYSFAVYTVFFVVLVSGLLHFYLDGSVPSSGSLLYPAMTLAWVIGMVTIPIAFSKAPVIYIAPTQYIQIFWGIGLGWLLFNDTPDIYAILGVVIIIFSGVYFFREENKT